MAEPSNRRLQVLQAHLQNAEQSDCSTIDMQDTAASVENSPQQYSVVLPERLSDPGPWTVRRYRHVVETSLVYNHTQRISMDAGVLPAPRN